jgi:hypothetical protein
LAKPWREYKRAQRKREREERRKKADGVKPYLKEPFFKYFEDRHGSTEIPFYADVMGEQWFEFEDDSGIRPLTNDALVKEDLERAGDSLGKAELLIGVFLDVASELARAVSGYKLEAIKQRLAEIEQLDPDAKAQVLEELGRLNKMRHELNKQARFSMAQWNVTDELFVA